MTEPHSEKDEKDEKELRLGPAAGAGFVRSALIFYGLMGCAALVWRMFTPGQSILYPSGDVTPESWGLLGALCVGAVVGVATVGVSEILTRSTSFGDELANVLGESLSGLQTSDAMLLALASGLAEEMLFRGALQPVVGIFWASLIFGVCHFLPRKDLALWSVFAVIMGFVFGSLYEWTGHLAAPVVAHILVNAINLPRLARRYEENHAAQSAVAESLDEPDEKEDKAESSDSPENEESP